MTDWTTPERLGGRFYSIDASQDYERFPEADPASDRPRVCRAVALREAAQAVAQGQAPARQTELQSV